jgi:hypothetical protein
LNFYLNSVTRALASGIAAQGWLVNALIESFVFISGRARLLLSPNTAKKRRSVADDYFDDDACKAKARTFRRHYPGKETSDKEVAHLTYARPD